MNVEIEFENYNIKSPKMPDPFNVNLINAVGSGGGGGGNEVELTWAEYEALSEAEKMNGTNYFITDINTTKSLTNKVLLAPSTISANTDYALTDSYKNYDYVVIEVVNSEFKYVRASKMLNVQNGETGGVIDFYQSSSWYGAAEINFTFNTVMRISNVSQSSNAYTDPGSSKIRITGYIYQRVVVPNQMINYSTIETKIGTWIDGKPLYQKVITFDSSDLQADTICKKVVFNVQDIDTVRTHKVLVENSIMTLPYCEPNFYFGYFLAYNSANTVDFRFRYSSDVANNLSIYFANSIAILQYTKTTD